MIVEPPTTFGARAGGRAALAPVLRRARACALRRLLGDRVGAFVLLPRLLERVPFDAAVLGEAAVLGGDDGALQVGRDAPRSRSTAGASRARAGRAPGARLPSAGRSSTADRRSPSARSAPGNRAAARRTRRRRAARAGAASGARARRHAGVQASAQRAQHRRRSRLDAAPEQERLGGLLDEHAETVATARAVRRRPRRRRPRRRAVHHVERQRAAAQDARPRPATRRAGDAASRSR